MDKEKKTTFKVIAVGLDMVELIELVSTKFEKEYGFRPTPVKITNLIAKRVKDNNLF